MQRIAGRNTKGGQDNLSFRQYFFYNKCDCPKVVFTSLLLFAYVCESLTAMSGGASNRPRLRPRMLTTNWTFIILTKAYNHIALYNYEQDFFGHVKFFWLLHNSNYVEGSIRRCILVRWEFCSAATRKLKLRNIKVNRNLMWPLAHLRLIAVYYARLYLKWFQNMGIFIR